MAPTIALINAPGDVLHEEHVEPPLGLLSIASYLKQKGAVSAQIFDFTDRSPSAAEKEIASIDADVFGFTVLCTKWKMVKRLIAALAERPRAPLVVVGGPNPSALPEETLRFEPINVVVVGEGERAFLQIIREYAAGAVSAETKEIRQGERLESREFPVLDRSLVAPPQSYGRRALGQPVVVLEASRGCRNGCIFCNSVVMGGRHRRVVAKDPEIVMREIRSAKAEGFNVFRFNDDSFVFAAQRSGLFDYLAGAEIRYRVFANVSDLTEDAVDRLAATGCFHVSVGIESYNPDNLRCIGKATSPAQIREGVRLAAERGIAVRAYFILGLPYDTDANVQDYMNRVAEEVRFHEYCLYPLIPYPGTLIWESPDRFGYSIRDRDFNSYVQIGKNRRGACVLRHRTFAESDVERWLACTHKIFEAHSKCYSLNSACK